MVEAVDRRTNMIVREKRRASSNRSSHIKKMERRFDQKAWTLDGYMGGKAGRETRSRKQKVEPQIGYQGLAVQISHQQQLWRTKLEGSVPPQPSETLEVGSVIRT